MKHPVKQVNKSRNAFSVLVLVGLMLTSLFLPVAQAAPPPFKLRVPINLTNLESAVKQVSVICTIEYQKGATKGEVTVDRKVRVDDQGRVNRTVVVPVFFSGRHARYVHDAKKWRCYLFARSETGGKIFSVDSQRRYGYATLKSGSPRGSGSKANAIWAEGTIQ